MIKTEFTEEDFIEQPHYSDILFLITWAFHENKEIRFKHLKYALVKNHGGGNFSKKKVNEMNKFFNSKNYPSLLDSINEKITTPNNLNTTYLANLKREKLISEIDGCYIPSHKCMIFINKYLCHQYIDLFFDTWSKKYGNKNSAGYLKASFLIEEQTLKMVDKLVRFYDWKKSQKIKK